MGLKTNLRVVATITISVGTLTDDPPKVAHRRRTELERWLTRHREDICAVVCSTFDDLDIEVETQLVEGEADDD